MNTRRIEWEEGGTEKVRRIIDAESVTTVIVSVTSEESFMAPVFDNPEDATEFARKHADRYPSRHGRVEDVGAFVVEDLHPEPRWHPIARVGLNTCCRP